jgi:hypothetical protein
MHAWRTRDVSNRLSGALSLALIVLAGGLAIAGCGPAAKPAAAAKVQNCGTSRTAANVPVEVKVNQGQVSCSVAMTIEASYAKAIEDGQAPGNGGGGPVKVSGWTCQGLATPQLLKTGEASKCVKAGTEIVETLKTAS